jgi:hypothetical protein
MATTATPPKPKTATAEVIDATQTGSRRIRIRGATLYFPKLFRPEAPAKKGKQPAAGVKPKYSALFGLSEDAERVIRDAIEVCCKEAKIKKIPSGDKLCLKSTPVPEDYDGPELYPTCLSAGSPAVRKTNPVTSDYKVKEAPAGVELRPGPPVIRKDGETEVTEDIAETVHCVGGGVVTLDVTIKAMNEYDTVAAFINGVQVHEKLAPCGRLGGNFKPKFDAVEDDEDPVDPDELN